MSVSIETITKKSYFHCYLLSKNCPDTFTLMLDYLSIVRVLWLSITCKEIDRLVVVHPLLQQRLLSHYSHKLFRMSLKDTPELKSYARGSSFKITTKPPLPKMYGLPLLSSMRRQLKSIKQKDILKLLTANINLTLVSGKNWELIRYVGEPISIHCFCCQGKNVAISLKRKSKCSNGLECPKESAPPGVEKRCSCSESRLLKLSCSDSDCLFTIMLPKQLKRCCAGVISSFECDRCDNVVCSLCNAADECSSFEFLCEYCADDYDDSDDWSSQMWPWG